MYIGFSFDFEVDDFTPLLEAAESETWRSAAANESNNQQGDFIHCLCRWDSAVSYSHLLLSNSKKQHTNILTDVEQYNAACVNHIHSLLRIPKL